MTPLPEWIFPLRISTGMSKLQHPQAAPMRASFFIMAGMPSASQIQFPNHDLRPIVTGKPVGMQENGAARHNSRFSCIMNAWLSLRRAKLARTFAADVCNPRAISAMVGQRWQLRSCR
jgi:hypothetical protein